MVPASYMPQDSPEIEEFCSINGPRGKPLLTSVNLFTDAPRAAEKELLRKLIENDGFIRSRYSKRKTIEEFGEASNQFRLHDEKIVYELVTYLMDGAGDEALAWPAEHPQDRPVRRERGWLSVHPALGSA